MAKMSINCLERGTKTLTSFICDQCQEKFDKAFFVNPNEMQVLCEECYKEILDWAKSEGLEE